MDVPEQVEEPSNNDDTIYDDQIIMNNATTSPIKNKKDIYNNNNEIQDINETDDDDTLDYSQQILYKYEQDISPTILNTRLSTQTTDTIVQLIEQYKNACNSNAQLYQLVQNLQNLNKELLQCSHKLIIQIVETYPKYTISHSNCSHKNKDELDNNNTEDILKSSQNITIPCILLQNEYFHTIEPKITETIPLQVNECSDCALSNAVLNYSALPVNKDIESNKIVSEYFADAEKEHFIRFVKEKMKIETQNDIKPTPDTSITLYYLQLLKHYPKLFENSKQYEKGISTATSSFYQNIYRLFITTIISAIIIHLMIRRVKEPYEFYPT